MEESIGLLGSHSIVVDHILYYLSCSSVSGPPFGLLPAQKCQHQACMMASKTGPLLSAPVDGNVDWSLWLSIYAYTYRSTSVSYTLALGGNSNNHI